MNTDNSQIEHQKMYKRKYIKMIILLLICFYIYKTNNLSNVMNFIFTIIHKGGEILSTVIIKCMNMI